MFNDYKIKFFEIQSLASIVLRYDLITVFTLNFTNETYELCKFLSFSLAELIASQDSDFHELLI